MLNEGPYGRHYVSANNLLLHQHEWVCYDRDFSKIDLRRYFVSIKLTEWLGEFDESTNIRKNLEELSSVNGNDMLVHSRLQSVAS